MKPATFTSEQEARVSEIVRSIVADVLQGTDARIRDVIAAGGADQITGTDAGGMAQQARDVVSTEPFTVDPQRAIDRRIGDFLVQFQGGAALRAGSAFCDASPCPVTVWSAPVPQRGEQ